VHRGAGERMSARAGQVQELQRLQAQAAEILGRIADESGEESPFYRRCEALWLSRTEAALLSAFHGDFVNANTILRRAVDSLALGPDTLRDGLPLDDVLKLMEAA
jgi:hypothetical protein